MAFRLSRAVPLLLAVALLLLGAAAAAPPDALRLLAAVGLLMGLGAAALRISRWLLPDLSAPSRITSALVFAAAMIVVPATALGHCGFLEPRLFLAVEALLIAATGVLPHHLVQREETETAAVTRVPAWLSRGEAIVLVTAAVAALLGLFSYGIQTERYTPPLKLDDPSYHLSAVAVWHHYHDLRMIKFNGGDQSTTFYPIGSELIDWALLAPLRDSDFLLRWSQVPFALGSLVAMAAIALHLGLSRRSALLSPLLYLTVGRAFPVLMFSAGNDHVTAFYTLAAVDAALVFGKSRTAGAAAYAGLALGLLAGTKYIGVLYVLPLLVLLTAAAVRRHTPLSTNMVQISILLVGAVAAGGYVYLRNAWSLGNPLFPAPVFGLPGWAAVSLAERRHLPIFRIDLRSFLLVRTDYFGHLFRFTMLPAAFLAPAVSLLRRGEARQKVVRTLLLALPVIFFLQFLYLMHDHSDIRYFFAAVALAAVAFCWLVESVAARWPLVAPAMRGGLAGLVAYKFIHTDEASAWGEVTTGAVLLVLACVAIAGWAGLRRRLSEHRFAWVALACGIAIAGGAGLTKTLEKYQERKYDNDLLVGFLDDQLGDRGTTIAFVGGNRPYPLFGSRLQHRVETVPVTGSLEDRFYRWGGTANFPFVDGTYKQWTSNLRQLGTEFVVIALGEQQEPERRWMQRHPRDFERVYVFASTEIWRFRADAAAGMPTVTRKSPA
jgi:hypothetical protein